MLRPLTYEDLGLTNRPKSLDQSHRYVQYVQHGATKTELFVISLVDYKRDSNLAQCSTACTQGRRNLGLILP